MRRSIHRRMAINAYAILVLALACHPLANAILTSSVAQANGTRLMTAFDVPFPVMVMGASLVSLDVSLARLVTSVVVGFLVVTAIFWKLADGQRRWASIALVVTGLASVAIPRWMATAHPGYQMADHGFLMGFLIVVGGLVIADAIRSRDVPVPAAVERERSGRRRPF